MDNSNHLRLLLCDRRVTDEVNSKPKESFDRIKATAWDLKWKHLIDQHIQDHLKCGNDLQKKKCISHIIELALTKKKNKIDWIIYPTALREANFPLGTTAALHK